MPSTTLLGCYSLVSVLQRLAEGAVLYSIADDDEFAVAEDLAIIHYPISIIRTDVLEIGLYWLIGKIVPNFFHCWAAWYNSSDSPGT